MLVCSHLLPTKYGVRSKIALGQIFYRSKVLLVDRRTTGEERRSFFSNTRDATTLPYVAAVAVVTVVSGGFSVMEKMEMQKKEEGAGY